MTEAIKKSFSLLQTRAQLLGLFSQRQRRLMSDTYLVSETTRKLYDKQAQKFATNAPTLLWWKYVGIPVFDRILGPMFYGRDDVQVLDLGTASARIPEHLIRNGIPARNIKGVEISSNQVAIARQRVPEAKFKVGDITTVRLPLDRYDLVTSNMVFEFLDDDGLYRVLNNAFRSLKHGGVLFYVTTHPEKMRMDSGLTRSGRFMIEFPWGGKGPNYYRTLEEFERVTYATGFKVDRIEELKIPKVAEREDPDKYNAFARYPYIRLAIKAHKP